MVLILGELKNRGGEGGGVLGGENYKCVGKGCSVVIWGSGFSMKNSGLRKGRNKGSSVGPGKKGWEKEEFKQKTKASDT